MTVPIYWDLPPGDKPLPKDPLYIWDDEQLYHIAKDEGLPKDRPVYIMRRMYDIDETMNAVLDMLAEKYPNVLGVCCVLNPKAHRITRR